VRASLDRAGAKSFDELKRAFDAFRKADGERMYEAFIDGTIRNEKATAQEDFVQRNFLAAIPAWGPKAAAPSSKRSLTDADSELNEVYRKNLSQFDTERASAKEAARAAQRLWLKYAAAWKRFAETLRPGQAAADDLRAFLIEQRIRELGFSGEGGGTRN
jgi:chromosome condensin MukBEF ATPase and DNA-binding subunit MukB